MKLFLGQIEFSTSFRGDIERIFNETVVGPERILYAYRRGY